MTAYHQLFVRTNKSEQVLVEDLSTASGAEICALEPPSNEIVYFGRVGNTVIEVELEHDFDDDRDLNFSAYPVLVTIRVLNAEREAEERVARDVFEKLKDIGGYDLLLVFNLQRLVARWPSPDELEVVPDLPFRSGS
jgi:hypothetical protein